MDYHKRPVPCVGFGEEDSGWEIFKIVDGAEDIVAQVQTETVADGLVNVLEGNTILVPECKILVHSGGWPGYWGRGDTLDEAKENYRKEGGNVKKFVAVLVHPTTRLDQVSGDFLWSGGPKHKPKEILRVGFPKPKPKKGKVP